MVSVILPNQPPKLTGVFNWTPSKNPNFQSKPPQEWEMDIVKVFGHKGHDKCFCALSKSGILRAYQFTQRHPQQ